MQDFEKLGVFYLGKPYDPETSQAKDEPLLYTSKDLVTHAVCVGMTGSGKTGLCISLLEEAAIDGIPAIAIDPKGDLTNLLLTFPKLAPEDFRPWINEDDARNKGVSPDDFARQQAELWTKGLASSGEDGARIQRLRDAADFAIYTPGSDAGIPISILSSFAAPGKAVVDDRELFLDRINATVTSLLGLVGIDADPIQSREHTLLSTILDNAWRAGQDLDLAGLITQIQKPPFAKVGVMDLESFFPAKDRFALALSINNLLASPGFQTWLTGEPLDIGAMLHSPQGKPRVSILSIAHLSDAERMFFVSLLLNQVLSWMRAQSGTTSLRAILYMDEIFGFFPPVANPPSKKPLLTLLKQARAFGLGVVLATQNPMDLDYKGLSNAGTWFIGRLQTDRDKMRVLDGLEGAMSEAGAAFDRQRMNKILSGLGNRVFLLNNVHEDAPVLFQTRWTLSYLRGPITRDQIRLLSGRNAAQPATSASSVTDAATPAPASSASAPVLPPDIPQYYVPVRQTGSVTYQPTVIGAARILFSDDKLKINESRDLVFATPLTDAATPCDWVQAQAVDTAIGDLEKSPEEGALFANLPSAAAQARNYAAWNKAFATWLFQTQALDLFASPSLGEVSNPGENERDFRVRLQQAAREERDKLAESLRGKYAPKIAALEERKRRAEVATEQQKSQQQAATIQTAVSVGASILGAFLGRKALSAATMGRAATAARQASRTYKESQDVSQAKENVDQLVQQLADLQKQFNDEVASLQQKVDPGTEQLDHRAVRPKRTNISVQMVALGWRA
jgi:hypothetical protein